MILKKWVKVSENRWVKVSEKLPPQVVDRSRKITAGRSVERYKLNLRFVHQRSRPSVCCYDRFMRILTLFTLPYFTFLYFTRSLASDLH